MNSFTVQPSYKGKFVAHYRNTQGETVLHYEQTFLGALSKMLNAAFPSGTISLA